MILFQCSKLNGILVSPDLIGLNIYHCNLLIQTCSRLLTRNLGILFSGNYEKNSFF